MIEFYFLIESVWKILVGKTQIGEIWANKNLVLAVIWCWGCLVLLCRQTMLKLGLKISEISSGLQVTSSESKKSNWFVILVYLLSVFFLHQWIEIAD
jgi:hypothetical protein